MEIDLPELLQEALKQPSNIDGKVAAGLTEDMGIVHYKGAPFLWHMTWQKDEESGEIDGLFEIHQVIPNKRKDRKPKLNLVLTHQI